MITAHPVFKNPKFNSLNPSDKTIYLSFKLQNYFHSKNKFCPDVNGYSTKVYSNDVPIHDFYYDISKLFESSYRLIDCKQFIGKSIRISDALKKLLKQRDLEYSFRSCFETFIDPIFSKLKNEVDAKKQLEIERIAEYKQSLEKQQQIINEEKEKQQQIINEQINAEKEKELKFASFKASILALGAEWEEEESE